VERVRVLRCSSLETSALDSSLVTPPPFWLHGF
jgi:hypothetical protein